MDHRFREDSLSILRYSLRVPLWAHWLECPRQVPLRAHRLKYRHQVPLRAYWLSRATLNDHVPEDPLLALKFFGLASLRAYLSWCYPVSPRAHWSSETLLSRLRSRGRSLSNRRFRKGSLAGLQQQMVQHPFSEDRCSRREAESSTFSSSSSGSSEK